MDIYGIHTVTQLLQTYPERISTLFVEMTKKRKFQMLLNIANQFGIAIQWVGPETLKKRLGDVLHQGIAARCTTPSITLTPTIETWTQTPLSSLIVVLDGVLDPQNLGACVRTVYAAGASVIIMPKKNTAPLNAAARKVACGAAERLPITYVSNLAQGIRRLKQAGYWVIGTSPSASTSLYQVDFCRPTVLVMGGEAHGMRVLITSLCDVCCRIPTHVEFGTLNVSAATAVCCFEIQRQKNNL